LIKDYDDKELKTEIFPRKDAKAQRKAFRTRQRFAPLRLCVTIFSAYRTFVQSFFTGNS
jgi:hypothetical protein